MTTIAAVVSKAMFEPVLKELNLGEGVVWPTDRYTSQVKALEALGSDGRLMLFTVRPPDEQLWLVAVLEKPKSKQGAWRAAPNVVPIRDVSALKKTLRFANGQGLPTKPGVLAMSLQTPRVLDEASAAVLVGAQPRARAAGRQSSVPTKAPEPKTPTRPSKNQPSGSPNDAPLHLLVELWRETRSARLAAVIEALDKPRTDDALKKAAEWDRVEKAGNAGDLSRLITALRGVPSRELARRITVLAERDDPRVVTALLGLLGQPPFTSQGSKPWWEATFAALKASGDSRVSEALLTLAPKYRTIVDTMMGDWASETMQAIASSFKAKGRALAAAESATLEKHEQALFGEIKSDRPKPRQDTIDLTALFDAIVESPDDEAPRRVFADALLSLGDARGEFITLQLERAAGRGTAEQADYERTTFWDSEKVEAYGVPFHSVAEVNSSLEFERGFPSYVELNHATRRFVPIANAPEWGTIRKIRELSSQPQALTVQFLESRGARNLRDLDVLPQVLIKLKAPTQYERVITRTASTSPWPWLPKVTHLELSGALTPKYFIGAPPGLHSLALDEKALALANADVLGHVTGLRHLECEDHLKDPKRLANCGLEKITIVDDLGSAESVLKAIPSLKSISCRAYSRDEMKLKLVPKLFEAFGSLEAIQLRRSVGNMNMRFVRTSNGLRLECLQPMWVGADDELCELYSTMTGLGVRHLIAYPGWKRHQVSRPSWLPKLKKVWGTKVVVVSQL